MDCPTPLKGGPSVLLAGVISALTWVNVSLGRVFRFLAWIIIAAMTAIVIVAVFFRYVLNDSLTWSEDVTLMLAIWMAFMVAPIAYRIGSNVALDTITRLLSPLIARIFSLAIHILILAMLVVLLDESLSMIGRSRIRANTVPIQMKYVYGIMPFSFVCMMLAGLELALRDILGIFRPDDEAAVHPADNPQDPMHPPV